ncbi:hypothetical protein KQ945_13615 [Bacillus subtilis subsp. subtilis]|nr:hypothetical protein [Bacillus subtilis subsp. subtilis]
MHDRNTNRKTAQAMLRATQRLGLGGSLLLLTGCSWQWVRHSHDAVALQPALASCTIEAEQRFPVRNEVAQKTVYADQYERCRKTADCDGKKYARVSRPHTESYSMDVNADSRRDQMDGCMMRKGWRSELKW